MTDEHAALVQRGGTLRLKVQADGGAPREFALDVAAAKTTDPAPKSPEGRPPGGRDGTNGVNVWDRYGGGTGSNRDDPTQ